MTPQSSVFADRTIFVLGNRRSGTTWLAELLFAHPEIGGASARVRSDLDDVIPSEPLIFGAAAKLWSNYSRPGRDGIAAYLQPEDFIAAFRAFSDRLFEAGNKRYSAGAPWYLEKSPDNVERLSILAATYPDAWNVHIVRDGRDVVRSMMRAPFDEVTTAAYAASEWVRTIRWVRKGSWRLPRFRELRYEELLRDPVGQTVALFEWLGLDVTDEVVERVRTATDRPVAKMGSTGPATGRWRDMDPDDLAVVYEIAGEVLAELGYLDGSEPVFPR